LAQGAWRFSSRIWRDKSPSPLGLQDYTDLESGLAEGPDWNVFALSDGAVYHTYARYAPDRNLLAPYYYQLLDQVPNGRGDEVRVHRRDEYEDAG
jgi:predicted dithiol-disulfide oxidoreductase (DUF899 family)